MPANPTHHICPDCFYTWAHGQDGTHVLRHTFASHFVMRGGNILVLQKILGHSSLTMTLRYAHLTPDHLQEALLLNPLSDEGALTQRTN